MQHTPLTGTHECKLDDRSRLAIPAKMRWAFAHGAVMAAWLDPCVIVVPREHMQRKIESVFGNVENVLDDNQRRLRRFLYSSMSEQESLDKQGRILIPATLRQRGDLVGSVTVVGSDDCIELWNPTRFEAHIQEMDEEGVSNIGKRIVERDS
jgi:MraZ protein